MSDLHPNCLACGGSFESHMSLDAECRMYVSEAEPDWRNARIAQLEAEVARLRKAVASAYQEGFFDGGNMEPTEQLCDDCQRCWLKSTAFKALQETADVPPQA